MRVFLKRITFFPIKATDTEFCTARKVCQALLIPATIQNTAATYKITYSRFLQVKWDIAFGLWDFVFPKASDLLYIHNFQKHCLNLI